MRQNKCRPTRVNHLTHVSASIAQPGHGPFSGNQFFKRIKVDIKPAHMEESSAVRLIGNPKPSFHGVFVSRLSYRVKAIVSLLGVTRTLAIPHPEPSFSPVEHWLSLILNFGNQTLSIVSVSNRTQPSIKIELAKLHPRRRPKNIIGGQPTNTPAAARDSHRRDIKALGTHRHHFFIQSFDPDLGCGTEQRTTRRPCFVSD